MITVKNRLELFALKNHEENELALVEDTHTYFVWKDNEWKEQKTEVQISLYEANLSFYSQKENYTSKQLKNGKSIIKKYVLSNPGEYFLLLNNEFRYYTVFHIGDKGEHQIQNEVYELLRTFDNIKTIELGENGTVEIWATYKGKFGLFMLFNYDGGVIECLK